MSERPLVVHVTTSDISLALLLAPQLEAFAAAGYDVVGASAAGEWVDSLAARGIGHVPLAHATRSWAPLEDARALVELYRLFRRLRPDVVHTHNPKPGVYGRLAARAARVPVVVNTVHGLYALPEDRFAKRAVVYSLERLAAACSDAELVQGPEDLETLASIGIPRRKLTLLGNGIDLTRFDPAAVSGEAVRAELGAGPDDVVVGVVARLVREKGIPETIDAAALLPANVRVVVVGPHEPDKADAISADDVAAAERDGVRFLGLRHDMPELYAAMDVLLFPSHREGFPRAPMEAAALGVPVIATDVRGCREAVDPGVTGLLVPVNDAKAIAEAVTTLAGDAALRARMGAAARAKALAEFDDRRVVETTLRTYERGLGVRRADGDVTIRLARDGDVGAIARLHHDEIGQGFLASLGLPFLRRLYRRMVRWPGSFVVVAERGGRVVGMSAATRSVGGLYRTFVVRDGIVAGARSAVRVVRSAPKVLETLRYPSAAADDLPDAELLSLAVAPGARGAGIGRMLATAVVDELRARSITSVRVVVVGGNEAAMRAYAAAGFAPQATVEVHRGVEQAVLTWR